MKQVMLVFVSLCLIATGVVTAQKRKLSQQAAVAAPGSPEMASPEQNENRRQGEPLKDRVINPGQTASVEFQSLAEKVLAGLPKRAELRKLTDAQLHHAPPEVVRAGTLLGRVAQALHDNPSLGSLGSEFYKRCTSDQDFVTSVRALCYARLVARDPLASVDVPANVRALSQQIMN